MSIKYESFDISDYHIRVLQYTFQIYHKGELALDEWIGPGWTLDWVKERAKAYIDGKDKDWYEIGAEAYKNGCPEDIGNTPTLLFNQFVQGYETAKEQHVSLYRDRFMNKLRDFLNSEDAEFQDNEYDPPTLMLLIDGKVVDIGPLRMNNG